MARLVQGLDLIREVLADPGQLRQILARSRHRQHAARELADHACCSAIGADAERIAAIELNQIGELVETARNVRIEHRHDARMPQPASSALIQIIGTGLSGRSFCSWNPRSRYATARSFDLGRSHPRPKEQHSCPGKWPRSTVPVKTVTAGPALRPREARRSPRRGSSSSSSRQPPLLAVQRAGCLLQGPLSANPTANAPVWGSASKGEIANGSGNYYINLAEARRCSSPDRLHHGV